MTPTEKGRYPTHFLNVDLDVYSSEPLESLAGAFGKKVSVHYVGREGRAYAAHLALASYGQSAERLTRALCRLVERLPPKARRMWNRAKRREFNVGVQAGHEPHSHEIRLTERTVAWVARLKGSVVITTYAAEEPESAKRGAAITSALTPTVSYVDAGAAVRWLTDVLGFRAAAVYEVPGGNVVFAQLVWRTGILFISAQAPEDNPWAKVGPASIALAAEDEGEVDHLYQRAVAADADIVRPVHDARTPMFPEGSHQFDVRDPEGNLWTVGTFQPRVPVR